MRDITLSLSPEYTSTLKASGRKIAVLTAYDFPTARLLEEAGIDWLLVGDSLGMVVLGYPDTTMVTLADMRHHTAAVARGARNTPIVADLPFGSYPDAPTALASARLLMEAGAHAVKLEGGASHAARVAALVAEGIPVMGHIGMLPQRIREEGAYRIKGRTPEEAERLLADAIALQQAGAFAMVLELVAPLTAATIQNALRIPTIGIGSGDACDGQVLVTHDLVGAFPWFHPKFVTPQAHTGAQIREAAKTYAEKVRGPQP